MLPDQRNMKQDFAPRQGVFTEDTWNNIFASAEKKYQEFLSLKKSPQSDEEIWIEVVRDFHTNHYWGFQTVEKIAKPPMKKEHKELVLYITAVFMGLIVLKTLIMYTSWRVIMFDDEYASQTRLAAILLLFVTLISFGWWMSRKNSK